MSELSELVIPPYNQQHPEIIQIVDDVQDADWRRGSKGGGGGGGGMKNPNKKLTLSWTGIPRVIANCYRRTLVAEIPIFAVHRIEIEYNETTLPDTVIQNNLCLLPFVIHDLEFLQAFPTFGSCPACGLGVTKKDQVCGCDVCELKCTLDVCGRPYDTRKQFNDQRQIIWSHSLTGTSTDKCTPVKNIVLLPDLLPNRRLKLTAFIAKGCGDMHARWNPIVVAVPRDLFTVTLDSNLLDKLLLTRKQKHEFVQCCPRNVFDIEDMGAAAASASASSGKKEDCDVVFVKNSNQCNRCHECINYIDKTTTLQQQPVHISTQDDGPEKQIHFVIEVCGSGFLFFFFFYYQCYLF